MKGKQASEAGQDLRTPFKGGVRFPTEDSKQLATSLLHQGQKSVEKTMKSSGPSIRDIAAKPSNSLAGSLPKLGSASSKLMNDPLIQYLRKHAAKNWESAQRYTEAGPVVAEDGRTAGKDWPAGERPYDGPELEQNRDNMPLGHEEFEMTSEPPIATDEMVDKGVDEWRGYLRKLFEEHTPPREKLYEKDKPPTVGEVDALLRKFE